MKTIEVLAYERKDMSNAANKKLRREGFVPGVLYSKENLVHFYAPAILFRDIVYTDKAAYVDLNVEGVIYKCILKDLQFHPVSETLLHVDMLELLPANPVIMDIPVSFSGKAPGIQLGGKLQARLRKLKVKALPENMPETVVVDISKLTLGKSVKVGEIQPGQYEILNHPGNPVATVIVPRALRGKGATAEEAEA